MFFAFSQTSDARPNNAPCCKVFIFIIAINKLSFYQDGIASKTWLRCRQEITYFPANSHALQILLRSYREAYSISCFDSCNDFPTNSRERKREKIIINVYSLGRCVHPVVSRLVRSKSGLLEQKNLYEKRGGEERDAFYLSSVFSINIPRISRKPTEWSTRSRGVACSVLGCCGS